MSAPNEASKRRLQKELLNLSTNPPPGISINADEASNNLAEWNVSLVGAESTLYDGELFQLSFKFPERYPFDSPIVVFAGSNVPVHPHVYRSRELSSQKAKNEIINKNKIKDGKIKERNRDEKKIQKTPHFPFYSNGHICLSILTDDWSPALSVEAICLSIISMLSSCTDKKRPPDDTFYVKTCNKNPKKTKWWYHDDSV